MTSFSWRDLIWFLTFQIEAGFSNGLAGFRFDSLFDYGNSLEDSKATNIINSHYSYLMRVVQPKLQERNKKRKDKDDLTYPYFCLLYTSPSPRD